MGYGYEKYEIEYDGMKFEVKYDYDSNMGEPWKEHDGHGIVSDWTTRDKKPGEKILNKDLDEYRYYDFEASTQKALDEGWDCQERRSEAAKNPDKVWSKIEIAKRAAEEDFRHLRAWCKNEWFWCGVIVTLLDVNGNKTNEVESLWGIESNAREHLKEVALELANEIASRIPGDYLSIQVRKSDKRLTDPKGDND